MRALVATLNEDLDFIFESGRGTFPGDKAKGLVDLDLIKGNTRDAVEESLYRIGYLFQTGKRKVFLKDDQRRFTTKNMRYYKSLPQAVKETILSDLGEAEAMASEAYYQTDGEQGSDLPEIEKAIRKFKGKTFKVEPVTSPRTGKRGFRISY
jgi:hypothetical protein